jgi:hypothetical protein
MVETILLFLSKVYFVVLKHPLYYGSTDLFYHWALVEYISDTGQIATGPPFQTYANFPLYHIFASSISSVLSVDIKTAIFLAFPIVLTTVLIIVYYLVSETGGYSRSAGIVMLVLSILPSFVHYGQYAVTRMMAFVGFMFLIYSAIKYTNSNNNTYLILFVSFVIYTILVHQVSIIQLSVIMLLLYSSAKFIGEKNYLDGFLLSIIATITIGYWLWNAPSLTSTVINVGIAGILDITTSTAVEPTTEVSISLPLFEVIRDRTYVLFSSMLLFLGTIYMIEQKVSSHLRVFGIVSLCLSPLFIPSPILLFAPDQLNIDRLSLFISPFIAMAVGIALIYIWRTSANLWSHFTSFLVILVVFCILSFTMVTAPLVTTDVSFNNEKRDYFLSSEIEGIEHIVTFVPENSKVGLDSDTGRYFRKYYNKPFESPDHEMKRKELDTSETNGVEEILKYERYFVFRKDTFYNSNLWLSTYPKTIAYPSIHDNTIKTKSFQSNVIFSSGSTEIWTR